MGERVGVGMGAGSTGVVDAIKVGKVTGVSPVPSVDSEAHPNRVAQTTRKNARKIQRFIAEIQTRCLDYCSPVFLQKPPLLL